MPRFFIDQCEIDAPPRETSSLDQLIKHIETKHLAPNAIIRDISIDGSALDEKDVAEDSSQFIEKLENGNRIDICTSSISDVAIESVQEAISYLGRVEALTPSLALSFQGSPDHQSFEHLKQLYEGFYWLSLLLDRIKSNFQLPLDEIQVDGEEWKEHHFKFVTTLKQLIDSQERSDFILISDLLEYELLPLVPKWREVFKVAARYVEQPCSSGQTPVKS